MRAELATWAVTIVALPFERRGMAKRGAKGQKVQLSPMFILITQKPTKLTLNPIPPPPITKNPLKGGIKRWRWRWRVRVQ
ncbi:hypothetical protein L873DRAFT_1798546 [Choiromyces venosus 120613-1]|uniref:Uncharacterized protein n=1 Tax=Choiromyces venosus 120613-1 TaxID=1336337 RepID=A0A3N4KFW2_9PEZI|nr:hypothetical protein L873DRAFT_1798546 [Choiromyces venosus 120613-1]